MPSAASGAEQQRSCLSCPSGPAAGHFLSEVQTPCPSLKALLSNPTEMSSRATDFLRQKTLGFLRHKSLSGYIIFTICSGALFRSRQLQTAFLQNGPLLFGTDRSELVEEGLPTWQLEMIQSQG